MLKANNKFLDNQTQILMILLLIHPIESRASGEAESKNSGVLAPWHVSARRLRRTNGTTAGVAEKRWRKARGIRRHCYRRAKREREEKRGKVVQVQSREKLLRDMLRDYTYRYNTLRSEQRQSSSGRERQRLEIVRSSAERYTVLGEVSMLAARRNFTGSPRHRDHM